MSKRITLLIAALSLGLSGCTMDGSGNHFAGLSAGDPPPPGSYCYENPAVCVVAGVVVVGLAAGIIANSSQHSNAAAAPPPPSDSRLKQDIQLLAQQNDGIRIYTFRYKGDDRLFSGVMAQDLLKDPAHRNAVSTGADGFYRVDYAKLNLKLVNGQVMAEAGEAAARKAAF